MAYMLGRLAPAILIGTLILTALPIAHADTTRVGRYMTVDNKPSAAQLDLLSQEFQVRFPTSVKTIGDAMEYLLKQSGYSLAPETQQSSELKTTLTKSLPAIDHDFGPMTLKEGLSTLAGPVFVLANDPLNRTVNFNTKFCYSKSHSQK